MTTQHRSYWLTGATGLTNCHGCITVGPTHKTRPTPPPLIGWLCWLWSLCLTQTVNSHNSSGNVCFFGSLRAKSLRINTLLPLSSSSAAPVWFSRPMVPVFFVRVSLGSLVRGSLNCSAAALPPGLPTLPNEPRDTAAVAASQVGVFTKAARAPVGYIGILNNCEKNTSTTY